ncbi:uncharacterized protein SOCE26_014370 [Sorangium cellulosum]|uniref:Uncharacterized protein n=1 Tax=Sorangium cellulosum TaxID=56 RepID=A0A2L0EL62_SORCE|nr:uncharacterized protein SOCE26_014370 [Sorangium cellulosum]
MYTGNDEDRATSFPMNDGFNGGAGGASIGAPARVQGNHRGGIGSLRRADPSARSQSCIDGRHHPVCPSARP